MNRLARHLRAARAERLAHPEDGQFMAMTVVLMVMFLAFAGLVVDGGRYLDARQTAVTEAQEAARAGAGALDVSALHAGTVAIDPDAAISTAESFMVAVGHPGTAWVEGNTVYTQVTYNQPTELLSIIGVGSMHVSVTESAVDVSGTATGG